MRRLILPVLLAAALALSVGVLATPSADALMVSKWSTPSTGVFARDSWVGCSEVTGWCACNDWLDDKCLIELEKLCEAKGYKTWWHEKWGYPKKDKTAVYCSDRKR